MAAYSINKNAIWQLKCQMGKYSHALYSLSVNHRFPDVNLLDFPYLNIITFVKYKRG